jgi:para-nitrobenzyl esterase
VFDHLHPNGYTPTPGEEALARSMMGYWTRFAAAGDPNGAGAPAWPRYEVASDPYVKLDDPIAKDERLHAERCDFWDALGVVK